MGWEPCTEETAVGCGGNEIKLVLHISEALVHCDKLFIDIGKHCSYVLHNFGCLCVSVLIWAIHWVWMSYHKFATTTECRSAGSYCMPMTRYQMNGCLVFVTEPLASMGKSGDADLSILPQIGYCWGFEQTHRECSRHGWSHDHERFVNLQLSRIFPRIAPQYKR